MLEEALEHLVKGIVEHPDDVTVRTRNLRRGEVLEVRVHPDDLGKVIGRAGRTAKALRTVVSALGGRASGSTSSTSTRFADPLGESTCSLSSVASRGPTASAVTSPSRCAPTTLNAASPSGPCSPRIQPRRGR